MKNAGRSVSIYKQHIKSKKNIGYVIAKIRFKKSSLVIIVIRKKAYMLRLPPYTSFAQLISKLWDQWTAWAAGHRVYLVILAVVSLGLLTIHKNLLFSPNASQLPFSGSTSCLSSTLSILQMIIFTTHISPWYAIKFSALGNECIYQGKK